MKQKKKNIIKHLYFSSEEDRMDLEDKLLKSDERIGKAILFCDEKINDGEWHQFKFAFETMKQYLESLK